MKFPQNSFYRNLIPFLFDEMFEGKSIICSMMMLTSVKYSFQSVPSCFDPKMWWSTCLNGMTLNSMVFVFKDKRTFYNETQWNSVLFIAHKKIFLTQYKKACQKRFVSVIASKGLSHDMEACLIYLRCNLILYVFLVWSRPLVTY